MMKLNDLDIKWEMYDLNSRFDLINLIKYIYRYVDPEGDPYLYSMTLMSCLDEMSYDELNVFYHSLIWIALSDEMKNYTSPDACMELKNVKNKLDVLVSLYV